jgi:uncharacterized protein YraI
MLTTLLRPTRTFVVAATTLLAVLGTAGTASATSYTVNTAGANLTVRSAPGAWSTAWGSVSDGSSVNVQCQVHGGTVTGTYGTSDVWDQLASGGFVSDTYVYTGHDGLFMTKCPYADPPPRPNPNSMNEAISWEFAHLGSTAYEGECDHFQALAFGWSHSGEYSAQTHWNHLRSLGLTHTSGTPPRGALVFYSNSSGTGHVVVSIGVGKVIGTSVGGDVGVAAYTYRSGYLGWATPDFPNGS